MDVGTLISEFQTMHKEHWQYVWGKHEKGIVDCSGAFFYVFQKHGLPMYNGSNRIARIYISGKLIPIAEARKKGLIMPGMAAFKHYTDKDKDYDLKSTYKPSGTYYNGDLNDYHHIGLIDDNTSYVLNAQSSKTGFVRSKISENWTYVAKLKNIEYGGESEVISVAKEMLVKRAADTDSATNTVFMRESPSTSAKWLQKIRFGSIVQAKGQQGEWTQIEYAGKTGWMMSKFLVDNIAPGGTESTGSIDRERLLKVYDEIGDILGLRG